MQTFMLVIHMMLAAAIVGLVLLQRSEGGALGMGGASGGGMGGLVAGRSAASFLTRATTITAGLFFGTSILLSIISPGGGSRSILDEAPIGGVEAPAGEATPGEAAEPVEDGGVPLDE